MHGIVLHRMACFPFICTEPFPEMSAECKLINIISLCAILILVPQLILIMHGVGFSLLSTIYFFIHATLKTVCCIVLLKRVVVRCVLQGPAARTPVGGKPPHPRLQGCNKENEAQLKGTPLSGALLTAASPQRNFSITSVASTYSEFVVICTFVSYLFSLHLLPHSCAVTHSRVLLRFLMMYKNANDVNLYCRGTWSTLNLFSQGVFGILKPCVILTNPFLTCSNCMPLIKGEITLKEKLNMLRWLELAQ